MRRILLLCALTLLVWPDTSSGQAMMRVYGATFDSTYTLYALSPDLLAGWNGLLRDYEKKHIPEKYQQLPILGGWYGQGFFPDREALLAHHIDKVLLLSGERQFPYSIEAAVREIGLPLVLIRGGNLEDYAPMFRELGAAFGLAERGEALAAYAEKTLAEARALTANLPPEKRVRVYLAQNADGLGTVCASANRSEILRLAGADNVHVCREGFKESNMQVSFEQVLAYDPDVLLVLHPTFMDRFSSDAKWRNLRAVKAGKVLFVPYEPFSWLDRPATYMRLMGLEWLTAKLHPELYPKDITLVTRDFMRLFFNLDLSDEALRTMLEPAGEAKLISGT
jgi:iron complex transport system substrate-binding protein